MLLPYCGQGVLYEICPHKQNIAGISENFAKLDAGMVNFSM